MSASVGQHRMVAARRIGVLATLLRLQRRQEFVRWYDISAAYGGIPDSSSREVMMRRDLAALSGLKLVTGSIGCWWVDTDRIHDFATHRQFALDDYGRELWAMLAALHGVLEFASPDRIEAMQLSGYPESGPLDLLDLKAAPDCVVVYEDLGLLDGFEAPPAARVVH